MSRVFYEFATPSGTTWTHRITCDMCQKFVEREGPLPAHEHDPSAPRFARGALVGWSSFSQKMAPSDPEMLALGEDLWPRAERDFCVGCSNFLGDQFLRLNIGFGTEEVRYLDSQGRKIGGRPAFGTVLCAEPCPTVCLLEKGHDGAHSPSAVPGLLACPVCADVRVRSVSRAGTLELRGFSLAELAVHAIDQHSVVQEEGPPAGWVTMLEHPRVAYADVMSALRAELKLLSTPPVLAQLARHGWSHRCELVNYTVAWLPPNVVCVCGRNEWDDR